MVHFLLTPVINILVNLMVNLLGQLSGQSSAQPGDQSLLIPFNFRNLKASTSEHVPTSVRKYIFFYVIPKRLPCDIVTISPSASLPLPPPHVSVFNHKHCMSSHMPHVCIRALLYVSLRICD